MWTCFCLITIRKRSLGQGNIFTSACQEFCSQGGCLLWGVMVPRGCPLQGGVWYRGVACSGRGTCSGGSGPEGVPALGGVWSWGRGACSGRASRPTPKEKLRGIRSRPTAKGEIEEDQVQHPPPPDGYCCRTVRILLECILV